MPPNIETPRYNTENSNEVYEYYSDKEEAENHAKQNQISKEL